MRGLKPQPAWLDLPRYAIWVCTLFQFPILFLHPNQVILSTQGGAVIHSRQNAKRVVETSAPADLAAERAGPINPWGREGGGNGQGRLVG